MVKIGKDKPYSYVRPWDFQGNDAKSMADFTKRLWKEHPPGQCNVGVLLDEIAHNEAETDFFYLLVTTCHTHKKIIGMAPIWKFQLMLLPEVAEGMTRKREEQKELQKKKDELDRP